MDYVKTGAMIASRRKALGMTQAQLAAQLQVSDKAVSKWERGMGCPDVSLLSALSSVLQVQVDALLQGRTKTNAPDGGNMKKLKFYVCPVCRNVLTSTGEAAVSCCGRMLSPLAPNKADEHEKLQVEEMEGEYFISSDHEMTKSHFISFVAVLRGDTLLLRKCYPEWDLAIRLPRLPYSALYWYCTKHGLFTQVLK